jgi:hypothetical protein
MENIYKIKQNILKSDFDLKIQYKEQHLDYLRNILLSTTKTLNAEPILIPQRDSIKVINNEPISNKTQCKECKQQSSDLTNCGHCQTPLCKSCLKFCNNTQNQHPTNGYCSDCIHVKCVLCREAKNCKACVRKCFHINCMNFFCNTCYEKNKHQVRPENTNCRFYKCDSCQTDTNCIMTTVYCAKCDKRVCKECFFNSHLAHNNR